MCKLGDKTFKKYVKELDSDMAREEEQISKIRELKKERNKKRNTMRAPPSKRRKLDESRHEKVTSSNETNAGDKNEN